MTSSSAQDPDQIWRQKNSPGALPAPPITALTYPRTVYVNSVTGNDAGSGTLALPWKTLARAWAERQHYLVLRAKFTVQLLGVGPYDLSPMQGSACEDDGFFVVLGDPTVNVVLATGTATGDLVGNVLPTSALAVNVGKNEFLRFTTGFYATAVFQVNENAANSVTIANRQTRGEQATPIGNGDAFQIVRPGTVIRISGGFSDAPPIENLTGITRDAVDLQSVRHVFYGVHFVAAVVGSRPSLAAAALAFGFCRLDTGLIVSAQSIVQGGQLRAEVIGLPVTPAGRNLVYGAGLVNTTQSLSMSGGQLNGVVSSTTTISFLDNGFAFFNWVGGSAAQVNVFNGRVTASDFGDYLIQGRVRISNAGAVMLVQFGTWRFVLTSGSCFVVQNGGYLEVGSAFSAANPSGGTTDVNGYGVDVRGGGRVLYRNVTPALTGGTAGSDLRTTNVPIAPNAALNANGASVAIAADSLLG